MTTNSNMGQAVLQMLQGDDLCWTELVRRLHQQGFEPSRAELQRVLRELYDDGKLQVRVQDAESGNPLVLCGEAEDADGYSFMVCDLPVRETPPEIDVDDEWHSLGVFDFWGDAWACACVDFLGDVERGRVVYRLDDGVWVKVAVCGQLNAEPLPMPKREVVVESSPAPVPSTDDYIEAELDAVKSAVWSALHEPVYRRLREDAEDEKVKLAFAVEVDLGNQTVSAKMSGAIKLVAKGSVHIPQPGQLELNLD